MFYKNVVYQKGLMFLLDFLVFLELLSGFSAIMIGLLFLTVKSKNKGANIFLVIFLWCLAWVILTGIYLDYLDSELIEAPEVLHLDTGLFLIPSLFLYIIITINKSFNSWYLLLFIPGVLVNLLHFEEEGIIISLLLFILINLTLMIIAFRVLIKHKNRVANFYSELEHKTLSWIKSIIIAVFILHFFFISGGTIEFFNEEIGVLFAPFETLMTLFLVYWIGYNGFFQAQLFQESGNETTPEELSDAVTENKKTKAVTEDLKAQFETITSRIRSERLFQNPNLNLRALSISLEVKEKELSKLINQCSQTNFYQFINRFRVEEFKNLLKSPKAKQLSILGLAEEAGFSSKSTFYAAFKSIEGITPKQYELSIKNEDKDD